MFLFRLLVNLWSLWAYIAIGLFTLLFIAILLSSCGAAPNKPVQPAKQEKPAEQYYKGSAKSLANARDTLTGRTKTK